MLIVYCTQSQIQQLNFVYMYIYVITILKLETDKESKLKTHVVSAKKQIAKNAMHFVS